MHKHDVRAVLGGETLKALDQVLPRDLDGVEGRVPRPEFRLVDDDREGLEIQFSLESHGKTKDRLACRLAQRVSPEMRSAIPEQKVSFELGANRKLEAVTEEPPETNETIERRKPLVLRYENSRKRVCGRAVLACISRLVDVRNMHLESPRRCSKEQDCTIP